MKLPTPFNEELRRWLRAVALAAGATALTVSAADTNAPPPAAATPPMTPQQFFEGGTTSYDNWVEFSAGGFFNEGNAAQARQRIQSSGGAFGGIEDFHFKTDLSKGTTLALDGRAIFDNNDYKFKLALEREKLGFLRFSYSEFRTWSDGDGGFYPPLGLYYPLSANALALDRGQVSVEGGLALENKDIPKITFKYTHDFRNGEKSSTEWGMTHPDLGVAQGLSPSFYSINEHRDSFQLDLTHHIQATDVTGGLRYETAKLDNALKIDQFPGEPVEQKITDRQGTTYDLFSAFGTSETWLKKNLMFSAGVSYSDMADNFSGSRIYGNDFDVGYAPAALNGAGYFDLSGAARVHEYVGDVNLFYKPTPHLTIVPSVRIEKQDTDANAGGSETLGANAPVPFSGNSSEGMLDGRERLDVTYNAITNWVLYARGDWTEGGGDLSASGGLVPVGGIGTAPIQLQMNDSRFFQKYSAGARWYPARKVTFDAGGYYKNNHYGYTTTQDSTANNGPDRYPGYLFIQNFETLDGNFRMTYRPWASVTSVTRYEYQWSTVQTAPDSLSGLPEVQSAKMNSQIIAEDLSWTPWSRLFLQAGFNYVLSETRTPVSDVTQAILAAQNNYWTLNFSSGFVLDDKSDLNVSYFYYRADDYQDNSSFGVPYGAGGEEQGITATLVRRLTKNLRVSLKYGYFHGTDETYGGNRDYTSQLVYSSLQLRF